jgi:hypothetical protein
MEDLIHELPRFLGKADFVYVARALLLDLRDPAGHDSDDHRKNEQRKDQLHQGKALLPWLLSVSEFSAHVSSSHASVPILCRAGSFKLCFSGRISAWKTTAR